MKLLTISLLTLSLFLATKTNAQTAVFKQYDFNKGGYSLLADYSNNRDHSLRDSLGVFYTDDTAVLNLFKRLWVFSVPGVKYACGYHYVFYLCKNGEALESFRLNLECRELATDQGYFYFDLDKLRPFYRKVKNLHPLSNSFKNIDEARNYRMKILKDSNLLMAEKPIWVDFDGEFQFTYKCLEGGSRCSDEREKIIEDVRNEISKRYPGEKFYLEEAGGSLTDISFRISCTQSLSEKFTLYYRDPDESGEWKAYKPNLRTYWRKF